jgi:hypothetical protein
MFPLIYRRVTRYLDTDDDSSIRKRESAARLKPWGLHSLTAIIPSEFSHSLPAEASAQAGPFFEQPCLTGWLHPGCQNTRIIRYANAEHGTDRPWVDFLPAERPARVRPFLNEIRTPGPGIASSRTSFRRCRHAVF